MFRKANIVINPSHPFKPGDRVICDPAETAAKWRGIVWVIEQIHQVNVDLRSSDGSRRLRANPGVLLPAPADGDTPATVVEPPYRPPLVVGTVVTVASPRWSGGTGLHVVLRDNVDTVRIVVLGGDNDRLWPKIPRGWITEVDRTALHTAVAGLRSRA